jgi:hypothetical protein
LEVFFVKSVGTQTWQRVRFIFPYPTTQSVKLTHLMVNAIQTIPSTYIASQIIGISTSAQRASLAQSLQVLVSTTANLRSTDEPLTYNATGLFNTVSSSLSVAFNQLSSTAKSVATTDGAADEASRKLAAALEASTLAENSSALDKALAKSVTEQILVNALAIAADNNSGGAANSSEISKLTEIAQQSRATDSAEMLDELLSASISQPVTLTAATTNKETVSKTDSVATLPSLTPTTQSVTTEPGTVTTSTPTTTTNVVATSSATTNNPSAISEVVNTPARNTTSDSAMQAVTTVAQNPAYPNLVASHYVGMAASMAQSPSVITPPIRLEEIKPAIAIPAISALSKLGAESGRDGNPALGYRQRKTNSLHM